MSANNKFTSSPYAYSGQMHAQFLPKLSLNKVLNFRKFLRSSSRLKELRHDILSHFFDGLSHGLSVGKPKTNGLLMKEKTKGVILKQKGRMMAEDGED